MLTFCQLSKRVAFWIRNQLVERKILPDVSLQITTQYLGDQVAFLCSLFCKDSSWMVEWIQNAPNEPAVLTQLRKDLCAQLETQQVNHLK